MNGSTTKTSIADFFRQTRQEITKVTWPTRKETLVTTGMVFAMTVNLIAPIAMDEGLRFAIREGGRTVGAGVVASIIE